MTDGYYDNDESDLYGEKNDDVISVDVREINYEESSEESPAENEAFESKEESSNIKTPKKKSAVGKAFKKGVAIVCAAALFGAVAGGALYTTNNVLSKTWGSKTSTSDSSTKTKSTNPVDVKLTTADSTAGTESGKDSVSYNVADIVSKCMPSVVAITNVGVSQVRTMWGTYQEQSTSAGSGVIVAKTDEELLILTNYHVVSNSNELTVVFSYDEKSEEPEAVAANLKGYNSSLDLAVIAISMDELSDEMLSKIAIAVVGSSDDLILGEQVVAIGNALGYGQSVTTGIVSALDREVSLTVDNEKISNDYIQTDAAINPGNSGGALLNMRGELVGINSAKVSNSAVEGMGYAIPISQVYDEIEQMMNDETEVKLSEKQQGYLGIVGDNLDAQTAQRYHVPQGIYLSNTYEGYAAANAGLEAGDIIIGINDTTVKEMAELKTELAKFKAGEKVTIKYIRYDEDSSQYVEHETEVTLDTYEKFQEMSELIEKEKEENNSSKDNGGNSGNQGNGDMDDFWNYFYNY